MADVEIEIPPRAEFVGVVRLALAALGRAEEIEDEMLDDLKIAVSEACANAVLSSESAGSEEPVKIAWAAQPDAIIVDVLDPAPDPDAVGEFSLALLRSLVDDLQHDPLPTGGRRTRLTLTR